MEDRYHRAAKDGYLEALKNISKRDCNLGDDDGMTPTLWASFEGNLETLRFLIGRGGDPEKSDNFGNTALHLASAKGHFDCVSFLVNFGVNVWALDIDMHSARELAAMNNSFEILHYLDKVYSKQEKENPAKVKKLKDRSEKAVIKLLKNFKKKSQKVPSSALYAAETSDKASVRDAPLKYSEMTTTLRMEKKPLRGTIFRKNHTLTPPSPAITYDSQFKIRETKEDGTLKIKSISGYRRDSEIIFVTPQDQNRTERDENSARRKEISGIFERPGFGSVAFRNSISASLFSFPMTNAEDQSIGSAGSFVERLEYEDDEESVNEELNGVSVILASLGLSEFADLFRREKIDLEALLLLNENDLKAMDIPVGPRKKLLKAIEERNSDIHQSIVIEDSPL